MGSNHLTYQVPSSIITFFRQQAEQKIATEGWGKQGRNVATKIDNFVHCWITEEAFKQILIQQRVWFRHRGLYFGDGLRSIAPESIEKWKTVAYPDDRFRTEQEKIADFHIVCNHADGSTRFFGVISKANLLLELEQSRVLYSPKNQEKFRIIPLGSFREDTLLSLLASMERNG